MLFTCGGTLIVDVPYNGDPGWIRPVPGAAAALAAVRGRGLAVGVLTQEPGVARYLLTRDQVDLVRRRCQQLLGPFDVWAVCPHAPADGCLCRRPAPGLVAAACRGLGLAADRVTVIGSDPRDLAAARAAGASAVRTAGVCAEPEALRATALAAADLAVATDRAPSPAGGPGRR
ncbi:HAD-IIIA family hydrolase [Kitasatospora nipponensis]|uniref:HAD-IIIA family hydrolase n=1 Tax=Kitasatospora nipponensis TaxID=258049 RepID=UPI0031D62AC0